MAAVLHLGFWKFAVFVMRPLSACRFAFSHKISPKSDNWSMRSPPSWIWKISIFGHVTAIGFNICCSIPNFIEIGQFFTEIWRFNDLQNGGRPPSWNLKNCSFCHVALVDMPFCFLTQNFAKIGQSVDELWPNKRFLRWRPPPSWI